MIAQAIRTELAAIAAEAVLERLPAAGRPTEEAVAGALRN